MKAATGHKHHSPASIKRVSDDLEENVEQFEEREDALRARFQGSILMAEGCRIRGSDG